MGLGKMELLKVVSMDFKFDLEYSGQFRFSPFPLDRSLGPQIYDKRLLVVLATYKNRIALEAKTLALWMRH